MVIALVSQNRSYPVTDASDIIGTLEQTRCGTALFILDSLEIQVINCPLFCKVMVSSLVLHV